VTETTSNQAADPTPGDNAEGNGANENGAKTEGAAPADLTARRLEELEAQLKDKEGKYLYLYADFENFKKRMQKERSDLVKFGWENVARDLLEISDNLDRVVEHAPKDCDKNFMEGLKMVQSHFHATLERSGVQRVQSLNKPFDPNMHEALAEEAADQPEGTIIREQIPGFTLHGRLLRPARVVVAAKKNTG
jgi:molecular chaperone GrpE